MMNTKILKSALVLIISLTIVFCGGLFKLKLEKNAKRFYAQGSEFYGKKDYSDAYYNFKQISMFSRLYKLSLLKQYQCAYNLSDKKTAKAKLLRLISITKDKQLRPYFLYNEALLSKESNNNTKLYKKFKTIYENYSESDFGIASAYRAGKIIETSDKEQAKELYLSYLEKAPDGKFSKDSAEAVISLGLILKDDESEILANTFLINQNYSEALRYFEKAPFENNWYNIAKCYKGLNKYSLEKETIIKGLELEKSGVKEKDVAHAIDRLIFMTKSDKIQTLQDMYTKYKNSYILPTVMYKLAENSSSVRSVKLYEYIADNYPDSIWASNSLWEMFWYNYNLERYMTCENIALRHKKTYSTNSDAPRIAYWYARVLLKERKTREAKDGFYQVIKNYPLSYYSFLSARQLKLSKAKKMIVKKPIQSYEINSINKKLFNDTLLLDLADNNDYETLDELRINDEYVKSWILNKKQNYPKSITLARDELNKKIRKDYGFDEVDADEEENENTRINFSDFELKLIYPVLYEDIINEYAKEFKQSPYLFLSLVREESHFNKNARSSAGALGLAQLMPSTANFIEKTNVPVSILLNEDENIRIGLKYFTYLTGLFDKDESLAILSYNAGPGNVNKWLSNPKINSDDIDTFVENIPYLETKNYIKKILSTYWVYLNIYSPRNRGI